MNEVIYVSCLMGFSVGYICGAFVIYNKMRK